MRVREQRAKDPSTDQLTVRSIRYPSSLHQGKSLKFTIRRSIIDNRTKDLRSLLANAPPVPQVQRLAGLRIQMTEGIVVTIQKTGYVNLLAIGFTKLNVQYHHLLFGAGILSIALRVREQRAKDLSADQLTAQSG